MLSYHFGSPQGAADRGDPRGQELSGAARRWPRCCLTRTSRRRTRSAHVAATRRARRCRRTDQAVLRDLRAGVPGQPACASPAPGARHRRPVGRAADEGRHGVAAQGRPEANARAEARLGVAVTRGLLLDLFWPPATARPWTQAIGALLIAAVATASARPTRNRRRRASCRRRGRLRSAIGRFLGSPACALRWCFGRGVDADRHVRPRILLLATTRRARSRRPGGWSARSAWPTRSVRSPRGA